MAALLHMALGMTVLRDAWRRVRDNGGCAGTDGQTLASFGADVEGHLARLREEVRVGGYRPLPLLGLTLERPGKKPRPLAVPAVRDRVLQTAVAQTLNPLFEAEFEDCSFGYRKGRSVDQAVRRIVRLRDDGYRWVVDADITAFFDEIDLTLLDWQLRGLVDDREMLDLIRQWLQAPVQRDGVLQVPQRGVAQGSPLSPLLANLYLDHLDETMMGRDLKLVRFADDFLILCRSRQAAEQALELTAEVLAALHLTLNQAKTRVVDFERGFRFLGVGFVRSLVLTCRYPEYAADSPDKSLPHDPGRLAPNSPGAGRPESALALALREAMAEGEWQVEPNEDGAGDGGTLAVVTGPEPAVEPTPPQRPPSSPSGVGDEPEASAGTVPRLQTLYVLEHGCVLGKQHERFVLRKEGRVLQEVLALKVDQIMVFGNAQITTQAMRFCLEEKIPIVLLSGRGQYFGVVDSLDTDPVLLHRDQFARAADPARSLALARAVVAGKVTNMRLVLRRFRRKREAVSLDRVYDDLKPYLRSINEADDLERLRGYEGITARLYFGAIRELLDPAWGFGGRVRQPPTDPVNSMLSYGYTLLFYNVYSLARGRGLNPHVGFLHPMRSGHPALVSDLMEEFRPLIVDSLVLNLVLGGRMVPEDFRYPEAPDSPCLLSDEARKRFIHAFEAKMNASVTHPATGLKLDYRRCIDQQARILAQVIRGVEPHYRAMVLR